MALDHAPQTPQAGIVVVDPRTGMLTPDGVQVLLQMWRQVVAGFVIVPCTASGQNAITLTPTLHEEGAATYAQGMAWYFEAVATSNAAVTIGVGDLTAVKAYVTNGSAQAGSGDVVDNQYYLGIYAPNLDSGNGGIVLW